MTAPWKSLGVFLAASAMGGCGSRVPETVAVACAPVAGPLTSERDPQRLVGSFRVVIAVTRGTNAGQEYSGSVTLHSADGEVFGSAALPVTEIGAEPTGDLASDDPMAPGARVVDGGDILIVRLGADANRAETGAIEGPHFALHVRQIDDGGFAGTWLSGAGMPRVEGFFCATRQAD